ncbi:hypothetical protein [Caulobacter sp. Root1455]
MPEKVHVAITAAIEGMTRAILTGADLATTSPHREMNPPRRMR